MYVCMYVSLDPAPFLHAQGGACKKGAGSRLVCMYVIMSVTHEYNIHQHMHNARASYL